VIRKQKQLFKTRIVPGKKGSGKLFEEEFVVDDGPVECLGMTFENDEKRREYFLEKLREKLKDPEFRKIEGFPIGSDEDILALSDLPYYTACPNPFIEDFIKQYGKPCDPNVPYSKEPFAADVSEGKNDPIYNAHSYHTKVPHKAIMRYILHYTEPGDVVLDGFCGTGMTGVAAALCSSKQEIKSLDLNMLPTGNMGNQQGNEVSGLGPRACILNDLSPVATFIARNYNSLKSSQEFRIQAKKILNDISASWGWMYHTHHSGWLASNRQNPPQANPFPDKSETGEINYAIWSDVFLCSNCGEEIVFWNVSNNPEKASIEDEFSCQKCGSVNTKKNSSRSRKTIIDELNGGTRIVAHQLPVLIDYTYKGKRYHKYPDTKDLETINRIGALDLTLWFPTNRVPSGFNLDQPRRSHGVKYAYDFYSKRNLIVLSELWNRLAEQGFPSMLSMWFTSTHAWVTRLNRLLVSNFFKKRGGVIGQTLSGTLYISSVGIETNAIVRLGLRIGSVPYGVGGRKNITQCGSSTDLRMIPNDSVDYIFTDPPFGGNIMYSDVNFLWESWLGVRTNVIDEAIVNPNQDKAFQDYCRLMSLCFKEMYRILKPGRWITVEFHNSKNSIWNGIQEGLLDAGFIIADVRILEKKHHSFKQVTSTNAVKKDLVISAYKPNGGLEDRFKLASGTEDGVWDFVRTHLKQLPVFVSKDRQAEVVAERQNYLLFDRMVAFHVQRGVTVPLSAAEFYAGLEQRFPPRDGMYFLPDQAAEYDKKRMTVKDVLQLQLFVSDEASAIQWLKQQLTKKQQTFQDIHPQSLKEMGGWQKHEKALELSELLEQNFLRYDGKGEVPSQIHGYLSSNFKELRNLAKDDSALKAKGKNRWYVPDPNKAGDLEKLRERALMHEFEEYRDAKQKRLKVFRLEAVRAGFKKAWQERNYATIIAVARKIPDKILQEDPKLLMWYDQAVTREGDN